MSGFFDRLARRATGGQPAQLAVRAPQRYEPAAYGRRWSRLPGAVAPERDAALDAALSVVADLTEMAVPETPAMWPGPPRRPKAGMPAARSVEPAPSSRADRRRPTSGDAAPSPVIPDADERPEPVEVVAAQPAPDHSAPLPERDAAPVQRPAEPPGAVAEVIAAPLVEPASVTSPSAAPIPAASPSAEVALPDLTDLVRSHVLPELRARGLTGVRERVEVREDAERSTPTAPVAGSRRGAPPTVTTVTVTGTRVTPPPPEPPATRRRAPRTAVLQGPSSMAAAPAAPSVQVHIDRVVVARPAPAARAVQPAPPPPARPRPDHTTYLARRREGR